jgi:hypothetical protein
MKGKQLLSNLKLTLNPKIGQLDVLSLYIHTFLLGIDFRNVCFFYLWRKVVCFVLFCSIEIHQTRMLQIVSSVSLESSWQGGVHGLGSMMFGLAGQKVLEYWMISSLKIKWSCSWKFRRNWNVPLMFLERSWWAGFNGIYLVRFGFRTWEILI